MSIGMTEGKDARTPEKPLKRHLKLPVLVITLGGCRPSFGFSWVLKLGGAYEALFML
jgi:hypothetical protein